MKSSRYKMRTSAHNEEITLKQMVLGSRKIVDINNFVVDRKPFIVPILIVLLLIDIAVYPLCLHTKGAYFHSPLNI